MVGRDGKAVPIEGNFTTVNPSTQVNGQFQLADGQEVGVAAPVILQFDAAIDDAHRPAVEKALKVTTDPPVEGSWAWLPDEVGGSRVHYRTKDYYPAGTKVHCRREALRGEVRRQRIRRAGHLAELRRSGVARSSRPTPRRTASRCSTVTAR